MSQTNSCNPADLENHLKWKGFINTPGTIAYCTILIALIGQAGHFVILGFLFFKTNVYTYVISTLLFIIKETCPPECFKLLNFRFKILTNNTISIYMERITICRFVWLRITHQWWVDIKFLASENPKVVEINGVRRNPIHILEWFSMPNTGSALGTNPRSVVLSDSQQDQFNQPPMFNNC